MRGRRSLRRCGPSEGKRQPGRQALHREEPLAGRDDPRRPSSIWVVGGRCASGRAHARIGVDVDPGLRLLRHEIGAEGVGHRRQRAAPGRAALDHLRGGERVPAAIRACLERAVGPRSAGNEKGQGEADDPRTNSRTRRSCERGQGQPPDRRGESSNADPSRFLIPRCPASAGLDEYSRSRVIPGRSFEAFASLRHLGMRSRPRFASRTGPRSKGTTAATGSPRRPSRWHPAAPRRSWRSRCRSGSSGSPR